MAGTDLQEIARSVLGIAPLPGQARPLPRYALVMECGCTDSASWDESKKAYACDGCGAALVEQPLAQPRRMPDPDGSGAALREAAAVAARQDARTIAALTEERDVLLAALRLSYAALKAEYLNGSGDSGYHAEMRAALHAGCEAIARTEGRS